MNTHIPFTQIYQLFTHIDTHIHTLNIYLAVHVCVCLVFASESFECRLNYIMTYFGKSLLSLLALYFETVVPLSLRNLQLIILSNI